MAGTYSADKIKVLEGLDAVRLRPGMYIGSTGSRGMHHLLWEVVDNAIDEALGGHATYVTVTLHKDGGATVEENGRGIPVDLHPQLGVSGVEVVFTQLHAGGKFDHDNYAYSGGLHGVGASVVNALSSRLVVEVASDFTLYRQEFTSAFDPEKGKVIAGHPTAPLAKVGGTRRRGTRVTFWPDATIFEDVSWNHDTIARRLRELAYLTAGIKFTLNDERPGFAPEEYCYAGGIVDYVRYLNEEKDPQHADVIYLQGFSGDTKVQAALQWTDAYNEAVFSFVNNIPTPEGGTHEIGFKAALTKVLNDYARRTGVLKDQKDKEAKGFSGEDFREGLTAVLCTLVKEPQFEGQTKGRLGNPSVRPAVEAVIAEQLALYLEDLKHQDSGAKILGKAAQAAKAREAARKAKDMARQISSIDAAPLVGKLAVCTGKDFLRNELFIVEGDSAGGSAKQGRDRRFQAVLPLRGKPLNAEKKRLEQVLQNEEFRSIITALGTGIGEDFDLTDLRYSRVIILADADQDGAHIRAILLTFFFRYMKQLVADGHVYIGMPPLYRVQHAGKTMYAYSDKELLALTKKAKGYTVQRYKGLGEMNPEQLWETTMSPEHRSLVRVTLEDAAEAERILTILMGEKVDPRRDYISAHANFNRQDTFEGRVDG